MSKFIPDVQIQSLRAMRAGDIAVALPNPVVTSIGVSAIAAPVPFLQFSRSLAAIDTTPPIVGTPSESGVIGAAFVASVSQNANEANSPAAIDTIPALAGTPSEAPVVGVGFTNSVVP